jgi:transcriptional regulator GlxA family with amidase domain
VEKLAVGIVLFDDVEVLDFAGPFEVFSRTRLEPGVESRRSDASAPFRVFTVAASTDPLTATGGLRVLPDFTFDASPPIDILVVPGGFGTRRLLEDPAMVDRVRTAAGRAGTVTSVCTGALVLAAAGLLRDRRATTHWGALDLLARLDPSITVERTERVVFDGIVTSAGVASGIDMALDLVARSYGEAVADETAHYIEFRRHGGPRDRRDETRVPAGP